MHRQLSAQLLELEQGKRDAVFLQRVIAAAAREAAVLKDEQAVELARQAVSRAEDAAAAALRKAKHADVDVEALRRK